MKPITLFKRAENEKIQQWSIELRDNMFRTSEGYKDGVQTTTAWTVCEGKNVGRSNETTPEEQAEKEVKAKVRKQLKAGWAERESDVDESSVKTKPMLAHKYEDHIDKVMNTRFLALQPKLDGIRCLGTKKDLRSKTNKIITSVPHIEKMVKKFLDGLPEGTYLDGELYNHTLKRDFNQISSLVRKQKLSIKEMDEVEKIIEYHIYDIYCPDKNRSYAERYAALKIMLDSDSELRKYFVLVDTKFVMGSSANKQTHPELDHWHKIWVKEGYEGSMIRLSQSKYEQKRTANLLKRKDWIDEEFELVDVLPGKGNKAGMAASVVCKDSRGEEFSAGIIGDEDYCKELLSEKHNIIGMMVTIKYQNLTPDRKVPRFAKMKCVRDYE